MSEFLDINLIYIGFLCAVHSLSAIIKNKNSSVAHFIILVIFITCCCPIFCNYVIGYPEYRTIYWYQVFLSSMHDDMIATIYDLYIGITLIILEIYAMYYDRVKSPFIKRNEMIYTSILQNKLILILAIFSPLIYIIVSGNISYFLVYGVRSSRYATDNSIGQIASMLILLSIYAYFFYMFSTPKRHGKIILSLVYISIITWLQGKRFILVIIGVIFLFLYTRNGLNRKQQRNLRIALPIVTIGIILFSYWYLVYIRPMSDTSIDSIYDMLRVDLGRDDVIKYVIEEVIIKGEDIVPYVGSTFLSTIFFFVPRLIWIDKPYPHYVYLTSSILGVPISDIPAGTTPSWLEMSIANFAEFGFLIGPISIFLMCFGIDRFKETTFQLIAVILVCALLTQNIDAYTMFVLIFILQFIIRRLTMNHSLVILFAGRKLFKLGNGKCNSTSKNNK